MALASLIVGTAELEGEGGGVRAALPFLGRSLIEHQARQAAAAGARHIVILVERVPAALVGAIDRLKRDGIGVELARSVADAADRIHPEERLLVIADGLIARQELVERAGSATVPSLFTVPDSIDAAAFERIDAGARWAGLALIDGTLLRTTAAQLGEWDLQSTLLRRIVQAGAVRIDVPPAAVTLAMSVDAVGVAERALLAGEGLGKFLPGSAREGLAGFLLARGIQPLWLRGAALAMAALAVILAGVGWHGSAALALAASGPLLALPGRIDAIGLRPARWRGLWRAGRDALAAAAVVALAWRFAADGGGWGIWPLAGGAIGGMIALFAVERLLGRPLVGPAAMALLFLPFAWVGQPQWGLAAIALAALSILLFGLNRVAGRLEKGDFSADTRI